MIVYGSGELAVVGCQHGNERFGKQVVDDIQVDPELKAQIRAIFANEEAYELDKRWIDTDLNRSFNRTGITGHEAGLAPRVLSETLKSRYLLDIHTTRADETFLPIVTSLTKGVRYILSHLDIENVALIKSREAQYSLIGNHPAAVSLEFGEDYSHGDEAHRIVMDSVKSILSGQYGSYRRKRVYEVDSLIPNDADHLPPEIRSGEFSNVHNGYVLMPRATTYQGFLANNFYEINITSDEGDIL